MQLKCFFHGHFLCVHLNLTKKVYIFFFFFFSFAFSFNYLGSATFIRHFHLTLVPNTLFTYPHFSHITCHPIHPPLFLYSFPSLFINIHTFRLSLHIKQNIQNLEKSTLFKFKNKLKVFIFIVNFNQIQNFTQIVDIEKNNLIKSWLLF